METDPEQYLQGLPLYTSFRSAEIKIGDLLLGGTQVIRIQSMTNTPTLDTEATVRQVKGLADAGCEIVRITAQNVKEAKHLAIIKKELHKIDVNVPLVADIHYLPEAAEIAARIVDKVRINPGNYSERKNPLGKEYSEQGYREELERIAGRLFPLLKICKEYGTAIRIGTNHGSLSERIMGRYGDTPAGMVESAMEFIRIADTFGFHKLVLSMKSSNIRIVLQANRLLAARMMAEGMNYPIHLGVTEAGDGEDGRIKSAAGIGTLLEEGIGDTIRVSLTEDPVNEIPFAQKLVSFYQLDGRRKTAVAQTAALHPFQYNKRESLSFDPIGGNNPPVIIGVDLPENSHGGLPPSVLVKSSSETHILDDFRNYFRKLEHDGNKSPVILKRSLPDLKGDDLLIRLSIDFPALLCDGLGDGIWLEPADPPEQIHSMLFNILQAAGVRITKTEFISCPSCGRTKFDIQETLQNVRENTGHLKGLKIAVMGCIVNGPGEMADADYGYVGAGPGKITLYHKQQVMQRNIDENEAVEKLIELIKENGDWRDG